MANIPVLTEASILFLLMSTEEQIKEGDVCIAAISGGIRLFVWDIWKDVSQAPRCARLSKSFEHSGGKLK